MTPLPPGAALDPVTGVTPVPSGAQLDDPTQKIIIDPKTGQPWKPPPNDPVADFTYGLGKPFYTAGNLAGRGLEAISPEGSGVQRYAQESQAEAQRYFDAYKEKYGGKPPVSSPQRDLGEALPLAAMSYALPGSTGAFWGRLASNTVGGVLSSVLSGDPNASPSELGSEALQGGALGAAGTVGTGVAARTAYPAMAQPGSDVRKVMDIGVRPTPGQAVGGWLNRVEQGLGSVPLVGDFIKSARQRAVHQFNLGSVNDALAPIGETLDATQPGKEAVREMGNKISNYYQRWVPSAGGTLDKTATDQLAQLRLDAGMLAPGRDQQFNNIMDNMVQRHIDPATGTLTGDGFKKAESDLGGKAADLLYGNADSDARELGLHVRKAQGVLRDWLARTNPEVASELRAANAAYAKQLRIEYAAAKTNADPGVFSPAQYQAAVSHYAPTRQVAQGTALGSDIADAGRRVLGATVPDSGTPFRNAAMALAGVIANQGAGSPIPPRVLLGYGAGTVGAGAVYNPVSQDIVAHIMASRYPWMQNVATGVRQMSPVIAGAGPPGLLNP